MMVGGIPTTSTWHGGETPTRAARCEKTLPCAASKQSGYSEAVEARWSNPYGEGAMRCKLGVQQGDGGAVLSCCGGGKSDGEGRRGNECTGVTELGAGQVKARCGPMWPY